MATTKVIDQTKCYFRGCKSAPVNQVTEKWGNKSVWCACEKHTPSIANRPADMPAMPFAYIVKPING